ncbi:MAG: AEC family transporter, partial [Clostridia bacterium]|nr:AEC family transporter [Clostridia bacterium]
MQIMNAFNGIFTIVTMIGIGVIVTKKLMNQEIYNFLSKFLMKFCVPALLFSNAIKNVTWDFINEMGFMLLVPFAAQFANYLIAWLCARLFKIPKSERGIFIAIFAVSNTIFIGLPVTTAIYGDATIPFVTACFLSNTVCFWSVIVPGIAADGGASTVTIGQKLKQIFSPPLLAFLTGSAINLAGIPLPEFLTSAFNYLGGNVTPISMMLIAYLLCDMGKGAFKLSRTNSLAILGRFILSPLTIILVCLLCKVPNDLAKVFVTVGSMPVMNQAVLLASTYKANDKAVAQALAFTCVMAVAYIPAMVFLLEMIF